MVAHKPASTRQTEILWPQMPPNVTGKSEVVYNINCMSCAVNQIGKTGKKMSHDLMNTNLQSDAKKKDPTFECMLWKLIAS